MITASSVPVASFAPRPGSVPEGPRQLAHVLGLRLARIDAHVRDDLRTQRLAQLEPPFQPPVRRRVLGDLRVLQALRTDAQDHLAPLERAQRRPVRKHLRIERDPLLAEHGLVPAVASLEPRIEQVHRGAADEAGHEHVPGPLVELLRAGHLLELPLAHDRDAIAHRHGLDLVVRDVDRGRAEVALECADLGSHLDAQLRVEVRQRLVHQERLGLADDRPAHRDALALPAGQRTRLLVEQLLETQDLGGVLDPPVDLPLVDLPELQPERDVLPDG